MSIISRAFVLKKTKENAYYFAKNKNKTGSLNIRYSTIQIKQYHTVTYLGCALDENISGETMALRFVSKINCKLRFLYRKNRFLSQPLCRLLCNALIQPHFDYACSTWYPNLNNILKSKLQIIQKEMHSLLLLGLLYLN